jgi:hypothetical protein
MVQSSSAMIWLTHYELTGTTSSLDRARQLITTAAAAPASPSKRADRLHLLAQVE